MATAATSPTRARAGLLRPKCIRAIRLMGLFTNASQVAAGEGVRSGESRASGDERFRLCDRGRTDDRDSVSGIARVLDDGAIPLPRTRRCAPTVVTVRRIGCTRKASF